LRTKSKGKTWHNVKDRIRRAISGSTSPTGLSARAPGTHRGKNLRQAIAQIDTGVSERRCHETPVGKCNDGGRASGRPSIRTNNGSERRIASKSLTGFKPQIRELTQRTRGASVEQLVEFLARYLIGWRAILAFAKLRGCCPIWMRGFAGDSECNSGGSGRTVGTTLKNFADVESQVRTCGCGRFTHGILANVRAPGRATCIAKHLPPFDGQQSSL
jgi:hypothetical protein